MLRPFAPSLSLSLVLFPLLAACSSSTAPDPGPWSKSFPADAIIDLQMAEDPASGSVALSGLYFGALDLGRSDPFQNDPSTGTAGIFLGMLDAQGQPSWSRSLGATTNTTAKTGVAFDPDGNLVVAGGFVGTVDLGTKSFTAGANDDDVFVSKLTPGGDVIWAKHFTGESTPDEGTGTATQVLAVDSSGGIALAGSTASGIGFGGKPLDSGCFVTRLDASGGNVYNFAFGDYGSTHVTALAFGSDGSLVVGGNNSGSLSIGAASFDSDVEAGFVAKLDPSGKLAWAFQLGGEDSEVYALDVDPDGNVLVGGQLGSSLTVASFTVPGSGDTGFVLQVGPDGRAKWLTGLPQTPVSALAAADGGGALVTGGYDGAPRVGGKVLPAPSNSAPFVLRLDGHGTVVNALGFDVQGDTAGASPAGNIGMVIRATPSGAVTAGTFGGTMQVGATTLEASRASDVFVARVSLR